MMTFVLILYVHVKVTVKTSWPTIKYFNPTIEFQSKMEIGIETCSGEESESRGQNKFDSRIGTRCEYEANAGRNSGTKLEGQNDRG